LKTPIPTTSRSDPHRRSAALPGDPPRQSEHCAACRDPGLCQGRLRGGPGGANGTIHAWKMVVSNVWR
jgi:hypothetical protein